MTDSARQLTKPTRPACLGVMAALLVTALSLGCATGGGDPRPATTAAPPPPVSDAVPTIEKPLPATPPSPASATGPVTCYYGPVTQTPNDGEPRVTADLLIRRTLEPEASRIVEDSVRFDHGRNANGDRRPRTYRSLYTVQDNGFELSEESGAYSGIGTLEGEPWRWTAWDFAYTLESGIRVTGRYEVRPAEAGADGQAGSLLLVGEKTAYGPDGSAALRLHENLAQISLAKCAELFAPDTP